jgi:hypothetical protein
MKTLLSFTLLFALCHISFAQDKIHTKDKSVLDCKIAEIGINEIKYYPSGTTGAPLISIEIAYVRKVILANGQVIEFGNLMTDPATYVDNKKHAIKMHFLSPLMENLAFSYEKSIRPGRSVESEFGIIGLGFNTNPDNKSAGVFIGSGYKFMKTPKFYSSRLKYSHILKGSYVKPQLLISMYHNKSEDLFLYKNPSEKDIVAVALIVNLGKQIVYDNFFLIDYSFGLGYGFSNQSGDVNDDGSTFRANHYGFMSGSNDFPLAFCTKLKIGLLIK